MEVLVIPALVAARRCYLRASADHAVRMWDWHDSRKPLRTCTQQLFHSRKG